MTCFSIHKTLGLALLITALFAIALPAAHAQTPEPPAEETEKLSAREKEELDAQAGKVDAPIIIELYTGSDCSACIFADRMLYDAMKDKQVIALSCRVNDSTTLLDNAYSLDSDHLIDGPMDPCVFRQWTYKSHSRSDVTLKMPVFYFNGNQSVRADDGQFYGNLRRHHYRGTNKMQEVMMSWKDKDTISIHLPQINRKEQKINASVWLVRYKNMDVVKMDKGINKGRVLRFSNIIQDVTHVAKWHGGQRVVTVDVAPPEGGNEKGGYVVLTGKYLGSEYLAAGRLEDYPVAADIEEDQTKRARARAAAEGRSTVAPAQNP